MPNREKLEADPATPLELFDSEKEYRAPIFQRLYIWGKEELDRLWGDIDEILDGEDTSRFLGAIVLQDQSSRLAFAPRTYWIIDGQQRITTLYLLLTAIAELAWKAGDEVLAREIASGYLFNQRERTANQPKIRPTNRDLKQFADVVHRLSAFEPKPPDGYGDESGKMSAAYRRLLNEVAERRKQQDDGFLKRLATVILENLKVVLIVLSDDEDPHQVFDALNNAGVGLSTIDLVRNEVFQKFGEDYQAAEYLFNTRWRAFEDSLGVQLDPYLFPFTLIQRPTSTKSRIYPTLKALWKDDSPPDIVTKLEMYVPAFKALSIGEQLEVSADLSRALDCLRRMPAPTSTYPFTMRVLYESLAGELDSHAAAATFALVEAFLVRRALAGFEPTGLHAVFKGMWDDTHGDPQKFVDTIDKNPTIAFPEDEQFAEDIKTKQLYFRRLARYVLTEYERGLKGGDPVPGGIEVTIDHVLPETLSANWEAVFDKETYERVVHTWANLVPLSRPLNSEKGQRPWSDVRKLFRTETIFKTTKRLAESYEDWNVESLNSRAEELALWAVSRWPKRVT